MASNKRPASDLSPRDTQEPKKIKKVISNGRTQASHPFRESGNSTPDSAKSTSSVLKSNYAVGNRSQSRSTSNASASRPGSPAVVRGSKNAPDVVPGQNARPPLKINTANTASPVSVTDPGARPILKKAGSMSGQTGSSVVSSSPTKSADGRSASISSLPPPRGPAPVAPMMASPATAVSTTASALVPSASTLAELPVSDITGRASMASLYDLVRFFGQFGVMMIKRDRLEKKLQGKPKNETEARALQPELEACTEETSKLEKQLVASLAVLTENNDHDIAELTRKIQALDERDNSRSGNLKAVLSRSQVSESPPGVVSHDQLETMVNKAVKNQISSKFAGLKESVSRAEERLPKNPVVEKSSSKESTPLSANGQAHIRVESTKVQDDLDNFKETINARIAAKDKDTSMRLSSLEKENSTLRGELIKLQETVTSLQSDKVDQASFSALDEKARSLSSSVDNVCSMSTVVGKLQTELKAVVDDVRRVKSANTPTDPRRRIFPLPDTEAKATEVKATEANSQVDGLQKSVDALNKRVEAMPTSEMLLQMHSDIRKVREESESNSKVLEQHDESIGRFERDLRADNARINAINKDINTLFGNLRDLESKSDTLNEEVKTVAEQTKALSGEVKNIKPSNGRQSDITRLQNVADRHEEELKMLNFKIFKRSSRTDDNGTILDAIDSLRAARDTQQKSTEAIALRVKELEKITASFKTLPATIEKLETQLGEYMANPFPSKDEVQQHFSVMEEKQTSLRNNLESIKVEVDFDIRALRNDLASLTADTKNYAESINGLDGILRGSGAMATIGLIKQVNELKDTMNSMSQMIKCQSKANDNTSPPLQAPIQTPSLGPVLLEKRLARVEQEVANVKTEAATLRIDFDGFEEAQTQQSELIEADVKRRIEDEVARVVPSDRLDLSLDAVQHMMEQFAGKIREEMKQLSETKRSESPNIANIKELEDVVFPKLEQSASTMVNEKLLGFNDHLARVTESLEILRANYPSTYAEAVADMVVFSQTQGKLSNFLPATLNAIRELQTRFDNIQTREMAVHMLNALMPHITNQQFAQTIATIVAPTVRDQLAPFVFGQLRPYVENELNGMKQRIEGASRSNAELANRNQHLREDQHALSVKIEDLERRVNAQSNAAETIRKSCKEDNNLTNARIARLDSDVQRLQGHTQLDTSLREDVEKMSQNWSKQLEMETQEYVRSVETIQKEIEKQHTLNVEFESDRVLVWESLKEQRENIENALNDVGEVQSCVANIARKVDSRLVPPEWLEAL